MPDLNKFEKLREIGYSFSVTCGLCAHRNFSPNQLWGTCKKHLYQHLKHTGENREVSIHLWGGCPDAVLDPTTLSGLGAHSEFLIENSNA